MKIHQKNYLILKAFTLVEIIVVIVILAILATIAFLSFNSYSSSARDSTRLSDMTNIVKGLGVFYTTSGNLPYPDSYITINAGTGYSIYQGTVGNTTLGIIKMSQAKDSLDNTYYSYSINQARNQFSIAGWLENKPSSFVIPSNFNEANAVDYSKRYLIIKGGIVGILTESGSNSPIEQTTTATGIDLLTSNKNLILNTSSTVYSNGNNAIYGSGLIIGIIQSNQNGGYSYTQPSTCPTGFIPVPGNYEFNQPGFCVAKYEMKQSVGDEGSWNGVGGIQGPVSVAVSPYCTNTSKCENTGGTAIITTKGAITSKPDGYPIVWLNQYNAIKACKSMGAGYHLITNNEWMTIARDIEKQSSNWSGGVIGTTLNRGQSNANWTDGTTGALMATQGEYGSPNNGFINKRTHNLSNGQIIWDVAGNVWEFVNKANTLDESNYAIGTNGINFTSPKVDICNSTDGIYEWSTCISKAISMNGPSNSSYTTANGVGGVWDYDATVFFRGGSWHHTTGAGVFSLALLWDTTILERHVGFRCAK